MKVAMAVDKAQSKKLTEFRSKHIADSQMAAAKLLGISQGTLSRMEAGIIPVNNTVVNKMVKDFGLSKEWWFHSSGNMKADKKSNNMHDIAAFREEVAALQTEVLMLNSTVSHFIKIIEKQGKDIEDLKNKLHHK